MKVMDIKMKRTIIGSRTFKTGIAVFITSTICLALDFPAVFAVITSIVSIEPTVGQSIKKGIIRFPASAIGSFFAVLFIFLFGNSPITYTGAAIFTIITCYKLKLFDGLLVATLTSVAMIEIIHGNFFLSFITRLGTTSIGLIVSTAVNFFIFPPDYTKRIIYNIQTAKEASIDELRFFAHNLLHRHDGKAKCKLATEETFNQLQTQLKKTEELLDFQRSEAQFHRLTDEAKAELIFEEKQLDVLKSIHYHIRNLHSVNVRLIEWSDNQVEETVKAINRLTELLGQSKPVNHNIVKDQVADLMERFRQAERKHFVAPNGNSTYFEPEIIILYEILAIFQLTESLGKKQKQIKRSPQV